MDSTGAAYLTGSTLSTTFPTATPVQGGNDSASHGFTDAFVSKLNAAGTALVYSTYLGGNGNDTGYGIAVDSGGKAYITGSTNSSRSFPTVSAVQSSNKGGYDAFVSVLDAAGSAFVYSTYLGSALDDAGYAIAVDGSGNAYVTGSTTSTTFPTLSAYQGTSGGGQDAFVAKLASSGSTLSYSTYLVLSSIDLI